MSAFNTPPKRAFPTRPPQDQSSLSRDPSAFPQGGLESIEQSLNQRSPFTDASMLRSSPFQPGQTQAVSVPPEAIKESTVIGAGSHESVERTQTAVFALSLIEVTLIALLGEFACLYRNVCSVATGVDVSLYASHAFVPILLISFLQVFCGYQSSEFLLRGTLRVLRISTFVTAVLVILFSVAEIIAMLAMVTETERSDTWNSMSSLSKDFYDNSISTYVQQYKANIGILAVFQIIICGIQVGIAVSLFVLYSKTPDGYVPRHSYEKKPRILKPPGETEMKDLSISKDLVTQPPAVFGAPVQFQLSEDPGPRGFPQRDPQPFQSSIPSSQFHPLAP